MSLRSEVQGLLEVLNRHELHDTIWKPRKEALDSLLTLVQTNGSQFTYEILSTLKDTLLNQLNDNRSTIVVLTLNVIRELVHQGTGCGDLLSCLMPKMIKIAAASGSKVTSSTAMDCATFACENVQSLQLFNALCAMCCQRNSVEIAGFAVTCLNSVLPNFNLKQSQISSISKVLEPCLTNMFEHRKEQTRKDARKLYWLYQSLFPNYANKFVRTLDTKYVKKLEKYHQQNGSGGSRNRLRKSKTSEKTSGKTSENTSKSIVSKRKKPVRRARRQRSTDFDNKENTSILNSMAQSMTDQITNWDSTMKANAMEARNVNNSSSEQANALANVHLMNGQQETYNLLTKLIDTVNALKHTKEQPSVMGTPAPASKLTMNLLTPACGKRTTTEPEKNTTPELLSQALRMSELFSSPPVSLLEEIEEIEEIEETEEIEEIEEIEEMKETAVQQEQSNDKITIAQQEETLNMQRRVVNILHERREDDLKKIQKLRKQLEQQLEQKVTQKSASQ